VANPLLEEDEPAEVVEDELSVKPLPALVESMLFAISKTYCSHPANNTLGLPQLILSLL